MIINAEDKFFASGRCDQQLYTILNEFLYNENLECLSLLSGEYNVFFFCKKLQRLIFARDIFGRKSLCWKITNETNCNTLEISVFPANSDNWYEIYPGTFFVLTLSEIECENVQMTKNKNISCLFDLKFQNLRKNFFQQAQFQIISYFPQKLVFNNFLLNTLKNVNYILINGDSLLKPSSKILSKEENRQLLNNISFEFYQRFEIAMKNLGVNQIKNNKKILILFSGGVDSFLVALCAGKLAPKRTEILLVNVAFGETIQDCYNAPDRQRSINAFNFFFTKNTDTLQNEEKIKYRLILVNVNKTELSNCRKNFIAKAILPGKSVLDDSIGCVLWFASQAKGVEYFFDKENKENISFNNEIELTLVGSGADEQLGGYARHRTIFEKFGFERLLEEIRTELSRIGIRNYGRDDRIGLSNEKNLLIPFLEDDFVKWLNTIPLSLKVDYSLPRGQGEKKLLRNVLIQQGVPVDLASQPKNAMQFGSNIVKLENKKEKGLDICDRLTNL